MDKENSPEREQVVTQTTQMDYILSQNYPNPFNPETEIRFGLPESSQVKIQIFNMTGQKVATIFNGFLSAGEHQVKFNVNDLPSGVYTYRLLTESVQLTKRMILLK